MKQLERREHTVSEWAVAAVHCDRCGADCDYYAPSRGTDGMHSTNRGRMAVPPRFVYSQLVLGQEDAFYNHDTGYEVQLCLACTEEVCAFINAGPGSGATPIYYDPMGS